MAAQRSIGVWILAAMFLAAPASCLFAPEVPLGPCADDPAACDDGNPCTNDVCGEDGYCEHPTSTLPPDDGNPCTVDSCADNKESHVALDDGTDCGIGLNCIDGKCACSAASECGMNTACATFACTNGGCEAIYEAAGADVDGANTEDCKKNVCDGLGNIVDAADVNDVPTDTNVGDCQKKGCSPEGAIISVDDDSDVPADDNNPCTIEACDAGSPVDHEPVANDTPCGPDAACGAAGAGYQTTPQPTCQAGTCVNPDAVSCDFFTCNGAGNACLTSCSMTQDCVPGTYCNAGLCVPVGTVGDSCGNDAQCAPLTCVDGVCCNSPCAGTCQTCAKPGSLGVCVNITSGEDPEDECPGQDVCNGGGACKKPTGQPCGNGTECLTGQCEDGVCCDYACPGSCKTCNQPGSIGQCKNVPSGETASGCDSGGKICNGSGSCKAVNGTPCNNNSDCLSGYCPNEGSAQEVCCESSCGGTCKSCIASRTGLSDGTCGNILANTDPDNECPNGWCDTGNGDHCCNGNGACNP